MTYRPNKIREIAEKLGISVEVLEEYLHSRAAELEARTDAADVKSALVGGATVEVPTLRR